MPNDQASTGNVIAIRGDFKLTGESVRAHRAISLLFGWHNEVSSTERGDLRKE